MKRTYIWLIVLTGVASVVFVGLFIWLIVVAIKPSKVLGEGTAVALIRIEGVITGTDESSGLGGSGGFVAPEPIINQLREAVENESVAAILLRVNSPGGTAAASEEIYREVRRAAKEKPVVVSISDIGASGAYYISSAASEIVASPASEVGSIGVIIEIPNLRGLFKKLGVDLQVITQGKFKDIGNPNRPLTAEERRILTEQSGVIYDRFIADVAKGRKMKESKVRSLANGLTYPGIEAKKLGLVDRLGNYRDALLRAGKLGKIEGEPEVVEHEEDSLEELFSTFFGAGLKSGDLLRLLSPSSGTPTIK